MNTANEEILENILRGNDLFTTDQLALRSIRSYHF